MALSTASLPAASLCGVTRLQALFRGRRSRQLHVERVRRDLPWSPFVPAKMEAVDAMLELADLRPGETMVDIGSGDGRVVIAAATKHPEIQRAVGVELDPTLVALSRRRVAELDGEEPKLRLPSRAVFVLDDFSNVDLKNVDVVVLFFLPHQDIARMLSEKLRPGTRVVTYVFQIAQWTPVRSIETVPFMTSHGSSPVFLYRVPHDPLME